MSQGNLEHLQKLCLKLEKQFGKEHPATQGVTSNYLGVQEALMRGETLWGRYEESPLSKGALSPFSGKIVVLIDRCCGSSCLNFIDLLKVVELDVHFVGETTGADSVYMELKKVSLPSGKGRLGLPIKVYRNRLRGHNVPHAPDVDYKGNLQDTEEVKQYLQALF